MFRLPQGPLSCLLNACTNTLSLIFGLFLCLTITHTHKCVAKSHGLCFELCNLRKHIYLLKATLQW